MVGHSFISWYIAERALTKANENISLRMNNETSRAGQATGLLGYQKQASSVLQTWVITDSKTKYDIGRYIEKIHISVKKMKRPVQ